MPRAAGKAIRVPYDPYDALRPWSAITHGAGAVFAVFATVLLLVFSRGSLWRVCAFAIYGASMICLYTASTLFHSVNTSVRGRLALRKYDHSSIFLLIAGSYTPVCLLLLRGAVGLRLLVVIWSLAAAGLVLSIAWTDRPRWVTSTVTILMGWLALSAIRMIRLSMSGWAFAALLLGGVFYTVGGVLYAAKWPGRDNPRFGWHEVFHVFVLLGSVCHFVMMLLLALSPQGSV